MSDKSVSEDLVLTILRLARECTICAYDENHFTEIAPGARAMLEEQIRATLARYDQRWRDRIDDAIMR